MAGGSLELSAELLMIDVLRSLGYFKTGATQPSASTHGCLASYACPPCRCAVFALKAPLVGAPERVWHSLANLVSLPARSRSPLTGTSDAETAHPLCQIMPVYSQQHS